MFVEPPRAMSTVIAFLKALSVMILLGVISFFRSIIIFLPASMASLARCAPVLEAVAMKGIVIPMASMRHCMVIAVNIPPHAPGLPQQIFSR